MELFLNLVWFVLSASLIVYWIWEFHHSSGRSKRPAKRLQLLTLALLIIILLPVISMTDDMQAVSAAEIEHVMRRVDLLSNSDQPADLILSQNITVFWTRHFFNLKTFARVEPSAERTRPHSGSIRQMATRPPPLAA